MTSDCDQMDCLLWLGGEGLCECAMMGYAKLSGHRLPLREMTAGQLGLTGR